MSKKKKKKRTGLGTGEGCMGLNIKRQEDCPFMFDLDGSFICNFTAKDCNLDTCKLKEYGRIIVDWRA